MLDRMRALTASMADKAFNVVAQKVKPEYIGICALSESLALLVMADRRVDPAELEAVSEFLIDMDIVIEKNLIREVSEFFLAAVKRLEEGYKAGPVEGNMVAGEILNSISKVKGDIVWERVLADTVTLVTSGSNVDPAELKTRERILKAIGRAA